MSISLFDLFGVLFFLIVSYLIYNKGWFFSFYSFFKFIIVFAISFVVGLLIAPKITHYLPLTNLQFSLVVQGFLFVILWKYISFKKPFFLITDKVIPINRFIFTSRIDKFLNIFPSVVVAFFFTFFIFTTLVSASTRYPNLQSAIESSDIVKPLAYQIYFATVSSGKIDIFKGVVFDTSPSTSFSYTDNTPVVYEYQAGSKSFTPYISPSNDSIYAIPTPNPVVNVPTDPTVQPTISNPTNTPVPIPVATEPSQDFVFSFFQNPTNTPVPAQSEPTPLPPVPQTQPAPAFFQIIAPPPINISTVEQDIFRLTNEQRNKNGLPAFTLNENLTTIARAHSQDMTDRNYFSHVSPDGVTILGRMQKAGITASAGGENIAGGPTADLILNNWMNSPGHRANILNPSYTNLGVGVTTNSQYGLLATQNFSN